MIRSENLRSTSAALSTHKGKHGKGNNRMGKENNNSVSSKDAKLNMKREKLEQSITNSSLLANRDRSKSKETTIGRDSSMEKLSVATKAKRDSTSSLEGKPKDAKRGIFQNA